MRIITHESGERLPILVDARGLPLVEPNVFIQTKRELAYNTNAKKLSAIGFFYQWAAECPPSLRERIASGALYSESEINGSLSYFLRAARTDRKGSVKGVSRDVFNTRVLYISEFLRWLIDEQVRRQSQRDGKIPILQKSQATVLGWLDDLLIRTSVGLDETPKYLSAYQRERLIEAIAPDCVKNPWKSDFIKGRNRLIVLLMLELGIRPAELLNLEVTDVQIGAISSVSIIRRPNNPKDPRRLAPQVKRRGRQLVISPTLARLTDQYIVELRVIADAKHKAGTDYLILSEDGDPLSYDGLRLAFSQLRQATPELPKGFSPKSLRHTFSFEMEIAMREAGLLEETRQRYLMELRGDTRLESQLVYTNAAIRLEAGEWLKERQKLLNVSFN